MITRIRTRSELILYIAEHAPSGACRRAVTEGKVVVLGGFAKIWPMDQDGWIVRVTSVHNKNWMVAVTIHPTNHRYYIFEIGKIPWANWVGNKFGPTDDIQNGDIPLGAGNARRRVREYKNET